MSGAPCGVMITAPTFELILGVRHGPGRGTAVVGGTGAPADIEGSILGPFEGSNWIPKLIMGIPLRGDTCFASPEV